MATVNRERTSLRLPRPADRALPDLPDLPDEDPTSVADRVERSIAFGVLAVRGTFAVQLLAALGDGLRQATRPGLFLLFSTLMLAETIGLGAVLRRARRLTPRVAGFDATWILVMAASEPLFVNATDRVGTWVGWAFGAIVAGAATVGAGLPRRRAVLAWSGAASAVYLAVSLPAGVDMSGTAAVNALGILGFAVAAQLVVRFVRSLAEVADAAQARAALTAAAAELERQRTLLHDQATVLNMLSRPAVQPDLAEALRTQAAQASARIRTFLSATPGSTTLHDPGPDPAGLPTLREVTRRACAAFPDLPLTVNIDLLADARVPSEVAARVAGALETLLHNVRLHARAGTVTVHGDRAGPGRWELTVLDDGTGFDPAAIARGYGLTVQAGRDLAAVGVTIDLDSHPGEGTRAVLRGRTPDRPPT